MKGVSVEATQGTGPLVVEFFSLTRVSGTRPGELDATSAATLVKSDAEARELCDEVDVPLECVVDVPLECDVDNALLCDVEEEEAVGAREDAG